MKKKRLHLVLFVLGVFLVSCSLIFSSLQKQTLNEIAFKAGLKLQEKLTRCEVALDSVQKKLLNGITEPDRFFESEKISIYFYKNTNLCYWNNTNVAFNGNKESIQGTKSFVKLPYGYYLRKRVVKDSLEGIALCLIKPLYPLQNKYLDNAFEAWTAIPNDIDVVQDEINGSTVVLNGENVFSLKSAESLFYSATTDECCLFVFISGVVLLLTSLLALLKNGLSIAKYTAIFVFILLLRGLMLWFKWPAFFYRTLLYDVRLFGDAQSFANAYLGDILLNSLLLLFVSLSVYFYSERKSDKNVFLFFKSVLLAFLCFNQYDTILPSLVTNSTLNFDFTDIFNVKAPVVFALMSLGFYALGLLFSLGVLLRLIPKNAKGFIGFLLLMMSVCVLESFISPSKKAFEIYWLLPASLVIYASYRLTEAGTSLILGVYIIILSVTTSVCLNFYIERNQNQELDILSLKLGEKTDAILESEYRTIPSRLRSDESMSNLLNLLPDSKEAVEQNLRQKFFAGYFDGYNMEFSMFDNKCRPLLDSKQAVLLDEGFFENQIQLYSDSVLPGLFFKNDTKGISQYIARIPLNDLKLYVVMEPKQFEESGSFPDLLLDRSLQKQDKLRNFSYVVYRLRQSTNRYGNFNYPYFLQDSVTLAKTNQNFTHFYFKPDETTDIVISKRTTDKSYFFTFNSYLLLFFSLLVYGCYLMYAWIFTSWLRNSSLTRRIQTIIVFLLLLAMSAVGVTSGRLVIKQFESDNKNQLHEKTDVIIAELSSQYSTAQLFDESQKELLNLRIREYSRLFNTPISLFNKKGVLFNTSEPKLYDFGLASKLVNARAFYNLSTNHLSSLSVNERAGSLRYLSYYTPLFDSKKQIAGFINLPYFAKQSDLTDELSGIISALINVYVILFVLSIIAGLILSSYITRPLQLIKQQFSKITLGKQNEKLHWPANDEIGKLVFEYNQMLSKLEESANLLAKSEREGAWREMAKQVAHEIKNPLTPMKLNLQYLQHLMKNNPDDFRDKFEKASSGIIEQIDSLANIATEFSNFAKLPGTQLQTINLVEVINASVRTFQNQNIVEIKTHIPASEILISGDKDQCLRVFNNVLKNAVQAVEEQTQPVIEISCELPGDKIVVAIKDNGCGIDEEQKSRIFTPNFTTKSTGSGLGLAMVKNIMQGFGGNIRFESQKNIGTVFYLEFNTAKP